MKKIRNNNGSTLATAVIVLMVVLIIIGGLYMVVEMYSVNTIHNHSARQAELYAKDESKILAQYLVDYGDSTSNPYYVSDVGNTLHVKDFKLTTNENGVTKTYGTFSSSEVWIKRESETKMSFKVSVKSGSQTETVKLICNRVNSQWKIGLYE